MWSDIVAKVEIQEALLQKYWSTHRCWRLYSAVTDLIQQSEQQQKQGRRESPHLASC
jgi:hypothetical protein